MQPIFLILLIGLAGGVAVGLQSPLSTMISQRLGTIESIFIVHLGGTIATLIPLLLLGGGKLGQWRSVPWYALIAGLCGLVVIGAVTYMIPRVGVAPAVTTIVAGQLFVSAVLDHFGWLGAVQHPLDASRLLGLAILFLGVWLTVK